MGGGVKVIQGKDAKGTSDLFHTECKKKEKKRSKQKKKK